VPAPWGDPPGYETQVAANARRVLADIAAGADERLVPTVAMAQQWHRDLYDGIPRPVDYYAGEVRDSDTRFPGLIGYEVQVGSLFGVPSAEVPQALSQFEQGAQQAASNLDAAIPVGRDAWDMRPPELHGVLTYCALLHGVWVQIHPFANGNGRTARLWANWAALRYGLPPFVSIKPRPGGDFYGAAAAASMRGDHQVMVAVFDQMLRSYLADLS
jgi:Fic family protein